MSDDDDHDNAGDCIRAGGALVPVELPIEPTDTAEEVQEAALIAERVKTMEQIDAAAKASRLPAVQFHAQKEIRRLTKLNRSEEGKTRASALLRRFVRKRREDEERRFRTIREENRKKASRTHRRQGRRSEASAQSGEAEGCREGRRRTRWPS